MQSLYKEKNDAIVVHTVLRRKFTQNLPNMIDIDEIGEKPYAGGG
jgi:hypothetical protein